MWKVRRSHRLVWESVCGGIGDWADAASLQRTPKCVDRMASTESDGQCNELVSTPPLPCDCVSPARDCGGVPSPTLLESGRAEHRRECPICADDVPHFNHTAPLSRRRRITTQHHPLHRHPFFRTARLFDWEQGCLFSSCLSQPHTSSPTQHFHLFSVLVHSHRRNHR
ncbi:hypothetical protein BLNAU_520 [Blattamonas nauphoetae]|uniref:RING-type domain-containing protein n=1 Tax=Blattamonas nauphoetae TaxID=2049346 RepID=A0ABQ9YLG5_9EUKA|nr:hypothetical protein BLNAU_520 [Blattamonas nauphoetae]